MKNKLGNLLKRAAAEVRRMWPTEMPSVLLWNNGCKLIMPQNSEKPIPTQGDRVEVVVCVNGPPIRLRAIWK